MPGWAGTFGTAFIIMMKRQKKDLTRKTDGKAFVTRAGHGTKLVAWATSPSTIPPPF